MNEENETTVEQAMETFKSKINEEIVEESRQNINQLVFQHCRAERRARLDPILNALSEFKKNPASSSVSYHGSFDGGLISHIEDVAEIAFGAKINVNPRKINLYDSERRMKLVDEMQSNINEGIITVAILHDLNKIMDCSGEPMYVDNILKDGKRSEKKPYAYNEKYEPLANLTDVNTGDPIESIILKYGGIQYSSGAVSLAVAEKISPGIVNSLSPDEIQAIVYHAGLYEKCSKEGYMGKESLLSIIIHYADMVASRYFS
jgi:hypothetical protein